MHSTLPSMMRPNSGNSLEELPAGPEETLCEPRERASAILAILASFILALCLVLAAIFAGGGGGLGGGGAGQHAGSGFGSGTGTGLGPGSGTGSADHGEGPGAGDRGQGRLAVGPENLAPPLGSPDGEMVGGDTARTESEDTEGAGTEPPKFGFTAPDAPPVTVPPRTAVAPGVPTGGATAGASGKAGGGGSDFMGVRSTGKHVVYVIDCSGSMTGGRLTHTKLELKRSIERLPKDGTFLVIFFDNNSTMMPPGYLVSATNANKKTAALWIDSIQGGGGTDPTESMRIALSFKPETIFLMTDGQFQDCPETQRVINECNPLKKCSVNTIAFHDRSMEWYLQQIAKENRGDYRYVPPPGGRP